MRLLLDGYPASLEVGKVYRQVEPHPRDMKGWVRIIDESGEDYLFHATRFVSIRLPAKAREALVA